MIARARTKKEYHIVLIYYNIFIIRFYEYLVILSLRKIVNIVLRDVIFISRSGVIINQIFSNILSTTTIRIILGNRRTTRRVIW